MKELLKFYTASFPLKLSEWLLNMSGNLFFFAYEEEIENQPDIWVTDVISGPIHVKDIPEEDIPEYVIWDDKTVLIEVRLLVDGSLTQSSMYTTFDHAYSLQEHFKKSVEPIRLKDFKGNL